MKIYSVQFRWFFILVVLVLMFSCLQEKLQARQPRYSQVIVIPSGTRSLVIKTLVDESVAAVEQALREGKRLVPAGRDIRNAVFSDMRNSDGSISLAEAAQRYDIPMAIQVGVYQLGPRYYGQIEITTTEEAYKKYTGILKVRGQVAQNIPLKLSREIAMMMNGIQVPVKVEKLRGDLYRMEAGQWQGLEETTIHDSEGRKIEILETGRYHSICRIDDLKNDVDSIILPPRDDADCYVKELERSIVHNLVRRKGTSAVLLKNMPADKRMLEGICIINPGGNLLLPAYGAYLSTHYLGFKDPAPSTPGLVAASVFTGTQLILPSVLTGFRGHFFPWVQDSDKTDEMARLHMFLWGTLPVTYTAAFLDQLAYQYEREGILPPFFESRDSFAAVLSGIFPGGGLFYKGHRFYGWGYYTTEMMAAGVLVFHGMDDRRGKAALATLAGLKVVELMHAWLAEPAYTVYNLEMEGGKRSPDFSMGMYSPGNDETCISCSISMHF